jgi:hypothetical protein
MEADIAGYETVIQVNEQDLEYQAAKKAIFAEVDQDTY